MTQRSAVVIPNANALAAGDYAGFWKDFSPVVSSDNPTHRAISPQDAPRIARHPARCVGSALPKAGAQAQPKRLNRLPRYRPQNIPPTHPPNPRSQPAKPLALRAGLAVYLEPLLYT